MRNAYQAYLRWGALSKGESARARISDVHRRAPPVATRLGRVERRRSRRPDGARFRERQRHQRNARDRPAPARHDDGAESGADDFRRNRARPRADQAAASRARTRRRAKGDDAAGAGRPALRRSDRGGRRRFDAPPDAADRARRLRRRAAEHHPVRRAHAPGAGARRRDQGGRIHAGSVREGFPAAVGDGPADRRAQRSDRRAVRRTSLADRRVHRAARRSAEPARVASGDLDRKRAAVFGPAGDARRIPDAVRQRQRRPVPHQRRRRADPRQSDAGAHSRFRFDRSAARRLSRSARSCVPEERSRAGTDVAARRNRCRRSRSKPKA